VNDNAADRRDVFPTEFIGRCLGLVIRMPRRHRGSPILPGQDEEDADEDADTVKVIEQAFIEKIGSDYLGLATGWGF
jgi:hypothetical protein